MDEKKLYVINKQLPDFFFSSCLMPFPRKGLISMICQFFTPLPKVPTRAI
jgi:hypothetical protein